MVQEGEHIALLRNLLGDDLCVASCAFIDRPPGARAGINPHIDGAGRPFHPQAGATLWIALDAMSEESGCLYYASGSHLGAKETDLEIAGYDENTAGVAPVAVAAGDAIIHHAQSVHWSGGNLTQEPTSSRGFFLLWCKCPGRLMRL